MPFFEIFFALPDYYFQIIAFVWGVVIGSFLNVFIYRFHTGKSLSGSSHCLSCQHPLSWFELFPLLSYLGLRGRCRACRAYIPVRYFLVELATAVLFVVVVSTVSNPLLWPLWFILVSTLVVISVYDLYHFVIPDEFVWSLVVIAGIFAASAQYLVMDVWLIFYNVAAAALAFAFFAGLWWYSQGAWIGFGDAKLAVPLGFMVGFPAVFSMLVLSFWIGALLSLGIIAAQYLKERGQLRLRFGSRRLTIKSEVPFAPFLILGFLAVALFTLDVLSLTSYVLF
jgi:leader peptidase (prepilin peptidase)/N-methyltransferase